MLNCFVPGSQGLDRLDPPPADIPEKCVWVDLLEPTLAEERAVERLLAIDVPSREEMREIETSSRLYEENGTLYMTATVVTKIDTDRPESAAITFILSHNRLITNRYVDPLPFRRFVAYSERHPSAATSAPGILAGLLEAIVERTADVLERVGIGLDELSASVFAAPTTKDAVRARATCAACMERIGRDGDLTSKARESLVTLARQLTFIQQSTRGPAAEGTARALSQHVARRAGALGPRLIPRQQVELHAPGDARPDQHRAEQHHQDLLGRGGHVPAADPDREHLWHELSTSCRSSTGTAATRSPCS